MSFEEFRTDFDSRVKMCSHRACGEIVNTSKKAVFNLHGCISFLFCNWVPDRRTAIIAVSVEESWRHRGFGSWLLNMVTSAKFPVPGGRVNAGTGDTFIDSIPVDFTTEQEFLLMNNFTTREGSKTENSADMQFVDDARLVPRGIWNDADAHAEPTHEPESHRRCLMGIFSILHIYGMSSCNC
jgi:GNAT superfamily N-acetyltransferase